MSKDSHSRTILEYHAKSVTDTWSERDEGMSFVSSMAKLKTMKEHEPVDVQHLLIHSGLTDS